MAVANFHVCYVQISIRHNIIFASYLGVWVELHATVLNPCCYFDVIRYETWHLTFQNSCILHNNVFIMNLHAVFLVYYWIEEC